MKYQEWMYTLTWISLLQLQGWTRKMAGEIQKEQESHAIASGMDKRWQPQCMSKRLEQGFQTCGITAVSRDVWGLFPPSLTGRLHSQHMMHPAHRPRVWQPWTREFDYVFCCLNDTFSCHFEKYQNAGTGIFCTNFSNIYQWVAHPMKTSRSVIA